MDESITLIRYCSLFIIRKGNVLSPLDYAETNNELKELLVSNGALIGAKIELPSELLLPEKDELKEDIAFEVVQEKLDEK